VIEGCGAIGNVPPSPRIARSIFNLSQRDAKVFEVLIGQIRENGNLFSAKRSAYSDNPSF
jgi:hypothetical protein